MKIDSKKWWMINSTVVIMVMILIGFILYILYVGYWRTRPIQLGTIVTNPNLETIKTNGLQTPTEEHIKEKLKQVFPDLNIDKINIQGDIKPSSATIISSDVWVYLGAVIIHYNIDNSIDNYLAIKK